MRKGRILPACATEIYASTMSCKIYPIRVTSTYLWAQLRFLFIILVLTIDIVFRKISASKVYLLVVVHLPLELLAVAYINDS